MSVTIGYCTARPSPNLEWLFDSLRHCSYQDEISQIIICDLYAEEFEGWSAADARGAVVRACDAAGSYAKITQVIPPKPNVWCGRYRLTPRNWWAKSNFLNTILCHATSDYIAFVDDRSILMPTFMDAVHEGRQNGWTMAGTYEKRAGMVVKSGIITHGGTLTGIDPRMEDAIKSGDFYRRRVCSGDWLFGCAFSLPLEFMLRVNGFDESWDSVSMEDTHFGKMLENNGFPIYHDGRMKIVEDRTPAEQDSSCREHDMKRSSKEKHPYDTNDKTHTLKRKLWGNKLAAHLWNFEIIRERVLAGGDFPVPFMPTHDFFDNQPLSEMT